MKQQPKNKIAGKSREVTTEDVIFAYKASKKEIESLKQYDRGEKIITPSKLKDLVRNI